LTDALGERRIAAPLISCRKASSRRRRCAELVVAASRARRALNPVGITGPTFAVEVAQGLPTALVVASTDATLTQDVAALLRGDALARIRAMTWPASRRAARSERVRDRGRRE
jgi:glycerol-3-phosphate dehydrogenase (NAD(P)+)